MKQVSDLTNDEAVILAWFDDFLGEDCDDDGIKALSDYLDHCRVKLQKGMTAGESILAHYRNPIGYDIDRAAMDLRTWPPIAARILELQNEEAERRTTVESQGRANRRKRRALNGHPQAGHPK